MHMHVFLKRTTNMLVYLLTISCVRRARGSNVIADAGHVRQQISVFNFLDPHFCSHDQSLDHVYDSIGADCKFVRPRPLRCFFSSEPELQFTICYVDYVQVLTSKTYPLLRRGHNVIWHFRHVWTLFIFA